MNLKQHKIFKRFFLCWLTGSQFCKLAFIRWTRSGSDILLIITNFTNAILLSNVYLEDLKAEGTETGEERGEEEEKEEHEDEAQPESGQGSNFVQMSYNVVYKDKYLWVRIQPK